VSRDGGDAGEYGASRLALRALVSSSRFQGYTNREDALSAARAPRAG